MSEIWVGIDPGARWTGIVARRGMTLLGWTVIDRQIIEPGADRPTVHTMEAVVEAVGMVADPATCRIAGEDATAPNPHVTRKNGNSLTNPQDIIDTARVIGYLQCAFPGAVLIHPGGNGSQVLASYPDELVTARERANAIRSRRLLEPAPRNPPQCHARSAWDVAGKAASEARIAEGPPPARSPPPCARHPARHQATTPHLLTSALPHSSPGDHLP